MSEETFKQIMDIWVTPEVMLRQEAKIIPRPYDLSVECQDIVDTFECQDIVDTQYYLT